MFNRNTGRTSEQICVAKQQMGNNGSLIVARKPVTKSLITYNLKFILVASQYFTELIIKVGATKVPAYYFSLWVN